MNTVTSETPKRKHRRAARFEAQRELSRLSSLARVRDCGLKAVTAGGVVLRVSGSVAAGTRSAGFAGLSTCGSVWACPTCSAKIAAHRQAEVEAALRSWEAAGHGVSLVTLTMRHSAGQPLKTLWDALAVAWHAAVSGRGWQQDQTTYGVRFRRVQKAGRNAGKVHDSTRLPIIRWVEVTHGANGWHAHVHALVLTARPLVEAEAAQLGERMYARWSDALVRKGLRAPIRAAGGLDARPLRDAHKSLGHYANKGTYHSLESIALETRSDLKEGRLGNRTPFQVLAAFVAGGDLDELDIWHEWEQASQGRRQFAWTVGLREYLGMDAEVTDDEVVDEDLAGDDAVVFEAAVFRTLFYVPGLRAQLLDYAEADDSLAALAVFLDGHGIPWAMPVDVPSACVA